MNSPIWYPGEPNDYGEDGVCLLIMNKKIGLNDLDKNDHIQYVCEREIETEEGDEGNEAEDGGNGNEEEEEEGE